MKIKVDGPMPDFKLELTYQEMCMLVTALGPANGLITSMVTPKELVTVQEFWTQLDSMIKQFKP